MQDVQGDPQDVAVVAMHELFKRFAVAALRAFDQSSIIGRGQSSLRSSGRGGAFRNQDRRNRRQTTRSSFRQWTSCRSFSEREGHSTADHSGNTVNQLHLIRREKSQKGEQYFEIRIRPACVLRNPFKYEYIRPSRVVSISFVFGNPG